MKHVCPRMSQNASQHKSPHLQQSYESSCQQDKQDCLRHVRTRASRLSRPQRPKWLHHDISSRQNNTEFHFYRATLCVSAVFAVSVRLSVTFVHSIQTAEDIVKLLCSAIILFFDPQHRYAIQRGTPSGTQNRRGGKILRFSTEITVYLGNGTRYAHDYNGTLIGNHRWRIDPCRFRWPWVTLTLVSRSLYSYKSNISKRCILRTKLL